VKVHSSPTGRRIDDEGDRGRPRSDESAEARKPIRGFVRALAIPFAVLGHRAVETDRDHLYVKIVQRRRAPEAIGKLRARPV